MQPPPRTSNGFEFISAPTSYSDASMGVPPSTRVALAVVPPMSGNDVVEAEVARMVRCRRHAAGGPDSTMRTGMRRVAAASRRAPFDCMISHLAGYSGLAELTLEPADIVVDRRADIGIHHRGAGAFVLADLRKDFPGARDADAGQHLDRISHAMRSCAGLR